MTKTALPALFAAALSTGCIVYDDACPKTGFGDGEGLAGDSGIDEAPAPEFWLSPAEGDAGDTLILSLQSDQPLDYALVEELDFTGAITVCTTQARADELLVTIYIDEAAEAGEVDLLIDMGGQDRFFVEDAFVVFGVAGSDDGSDGSDGSDGGSGDGSDGSTGDGSDGSGGGGGCG